MARIAAEIAESDPTVLYAEPDRIKRHTALPNDPGLASLWHHKNAPGGIDVESAWGGGTGTGVVVAVVDTGYRPHADLKASIVVGYDLIHLDGSSRRKKGTATSGPKPR